MYHGLLFGRDARVIEIPGQAIIPPNASVRAHPVACRFGWVFLWMGDADAADEDLLPQMHEADQDDFELGRGVLDYDAEAELINNNLLDFSHLTFVHADSFRAGDDWVTSPMRVTPLARGVRFERWIENSLGPGAYGTQVVSDGRVSYDYLVPGILLMLNGTFPVGTARRLGGGRPDFAEAQNYVGLSIQAVTPVSHGKSRYYFMSGPRRDMGGAALRDVMVRTALKAFEEDRVMIQGQQLVIARDPSRPVMPTIHDRGVTLFNRLTSRLAAAGDDASSSHAVLRAAETNQQGIFGTA